MFALKMVVELKTQQKSDKNIIKPQPAGGKVFKTIHIVFRNACE